MKRALAAVWMPATVASLAMCAGPGERPAGSGDAGADAPPATGGGDSGGIADGGSGGDSGVESGAPDGATDSASDAGGNPPGSVGTVTGCASGSSHVTITNGNAALDYDLTAGTATFSYSAAKKIAGFTAQMKLAGKTLTSAMYASRTCATSGTDTTVTLTGAGLPTMQQLFVSKASGYFLTQVSLLASASGTSLSSNWMGPLVTSAAGSVDVGSSADLRVLVVPFDNDMFVKYDAAPLAHATGTSFEVAAFYDNTSRNGIVVGSVTHDTWKTGISYQAGSTAVDALEVYGGANDAKSTHDLAPHGSVSGSAIASPVVFFGYGNDWRDMMESFADANATYVPRLPWTGGAPFGWNSWGVIQTGINYTKAIAVSNFLKSSLQGGGFNNGGTVYVDLDSYWDNLSVSELQMFAAHCHANGQKAGAYWGPFADWGGNMPAAQVKDPSGKPITIDGAPALDPTHQATRSRIDSTIGRFKSAGLDYVKLDFLTHGSLESSVRADPTVQTGIQAYNQGMKYIVDAIGGTMFIDESIAPLFPYQYAHGRRVSCDAFGNAGSSNYELNSASYGWWLAGRLYSYNDPDQLVFQGFTPAENRLRLMSSIVTGGIFFDGDDLTTSAGQAAATQNLSNGAFDEVARLGKAFRPVEGTSGTAPANLLVMKNGADAYLAVFDSSGGGSVSIDLARAGLDPTRSYTVTNLWTGATSAAPAGKATLTIPIDKGSGELLKLH